MVGYRHGARAALLLVLLAVGGVARGDNWSASLSASLKVDNRIEPGGGRSGGLALRYEYWDDERSLRTALDLVARRDEEAFEEGQQLYQGFVEKGIGALDATLRLGRFERADALGFYYLDGVEASGRLPLAGARYALYLGAPGRLEDVRSIDGEWLAGAELSLPLAGRPAAGAGLVARAGFQYLEEARIARRLTLGLEGAGGAQIGGRPRYRLRGSASYALEAARLDELQWDGELALTPALGVNAAYEHYRPQLDLHPGFRERYFSHYALGEQRVLRAALEGRIDERTDWRIETLRSRRDPGEAGRGLNLTLARRLAHGLELSATADFVELGGDRLGGVYGSLAKDLSSRLTLQLDGVASAERKRLVGENRVVGLAARGRYMVQSDLILALELSAVNNSRLRDEYAGELRLTWYLDPFRPKRATAYRPRVR